MRGIRLLVALVTVVALCGGVLGVRGSQWWCERQAAADLADLRERGAELLGERAATVSEVDTCHEYGGTNMAQVVFEVPSWTSRQQVKQAALAAGWVSAHGTLLSADGVVELEYPLTNDRTRDGLRYASIMLARTDRPTLGEG